MPTKPITLKPGDFEDDTPSPSASGAVTLAPGDYEDDAPAPINPYANWREKQDVGRELTNIAHGPGSTDPYIETPAGFSLGPRAKPSMLRPQPPTPAEEAFSQDENTGQFVRPGQPRPRTNFEASQQVLHPAAPVLVPSRLTSPATPAQIAQEATAHPVVPLKTLGSSTLNALLLSGKDIGAAPSPTRGQEAAYQAQQRERPTGLAAGPRQAVGQIQSGLTNVTEGMDPNPHAGMSPSEALELGIGLPDYNKSSAPNNPQAFKGGTQILQGSMTLGTPAFAAGVAAAPIRAGLMYLGGVASGDAAEYAAKKAGLSQEGQEFFNVVGFFGFNSLTAAAGLHGEIRPLMGREAVPGTVRPLWEPGTERPMVDPKTGQPPIDPTTGKVAIDPQTGKPWTTGEPMRDEAGNVMRDPATGQWVDKRFPGAVIGGRGFAAGVGRDATGGWQGTVRVGPYEASFGRRGSSTPRPGAQPGGQAPAPPDGATIQGQAQLQTVTETAARAAETRQQAQQVAGMAPPPPPPPQRGQAGSGQTPLPPGMENGHISPQTISFAARAVKMLPPTLQPQAIRLAIGKLADWMRGQKTVVGPDNKAVNVDSDKSAQTEAIKIINDAVDQETAAGEAQAKAQEDARKQAEKVAKEQEKAAKQAEKDQETADKERQDALKGTTATTQPSQAPDNPLTQAIRTALQAHPEPATRQSLNKLVGTFPVVPTATRDLLVQEELTRRGNAKEDEGQANLTGQAPAAGESRDDLQKWAEQLLAGDHSFMLVPVGSTFKPALSTDSKAAFTKTPVKNSPVPELNGDYYHPKTIKNSEIRAAAESSDPRAALAAIEKKWRQENPTELAPGEFEEETPAAKVDEKPAGDLSQGMSEEQPEDMGHMSPESQPELLDWIEGSIEEGQGNATLIPWIEQDATQSVTAATATFEKAGWKWNPEKKQLEKDGWYVWFRSQGKLASPIVQWNKLETQPEAKAGNKSTEKAPAALPRDLTGSKPRYGYGEKNFELEFADPRDLAVYTLSQKAPNKRHNDFLKYYESQFPGRSKDERDDHAAKVRNYIKGIVQEGMHTPAHGPIKVPSLAEGKQPAKKPVTPQVAPIKGVTPLGAKPAAGAMKLTQDWGVESINGYSDDPMREEGNPLKDKFLAEGKRYLSAVSSELIAAGFKPQRGRKGKESKPVHINEGGTAVAGDVYLSLNGPDDKGIQVQIHGDLGHLPMVPRTKSGVSIRYTATGLDGKDSSKYPNNWAPVNLSASELAQRLMKHVGVEPGKTPVIKSPAAGTGETKGKEPWEMTPAEYRAAHPEKAERAPKFINESTVDIDGGATADQLAEKYTQKELKAIAYVMNTPVYGTKPVLAQRLIDTWNLRKTLSTATEESLQEKTGAELKEMVRQIGGWLGAPKAGKAGQLIDWRNKSRSAAQERLGDWNHWLEVSKAHEEGKPVSQANIDLYKLEEKPEEAEPVETAVLEKERNDNTAKLKELDERGKAALDAAVTAGEVKGPDDLDTAPSLAGINAEKLALNKRNQEIRQELWQRELAGVKFTEEEYQKFIAPFADAEKNLGKDNETSIERRIRLFTSDNNKKSVAMAQRAKREGLLKPANDHEWMQPDYIVTADPTPESMAKLIERYRREWRQKKTSIVAAKDAYEAAKATAPETKRTEMLRKTYESVKRWEYMTRRNSEQWAAEYERVTGKAYEGKAEVPVGPREAKAEAPIPEYLTKNPKSTKRMIRRLGATTLEEDAARNKAMQAPAPRNGTQVAPTTHPMTYLSGHHSDELAKNAKQRGDIGLMLTPNRSDYLKVADQYPVIAVDNGAFGKEGFDEKKFMALALGVARDPDLKAKVRFVVAPDVPMNAAGTLDKFDQWASWLHQQGLPVALAAQNGMEDMEIPWDKVDVLFLGGNTDWKIGRDAKESFYDMLRKAESLGIPLHMGRVNSAERTELANYGLGATTVDGTYLKHGPEVNLPNLLGWLDGENATGPTEAKPAESEETPTFKAGDKVTFTDFAGKEREGIILEAQPKRAIIKASNGDRIPVPLEKIKPAAEPEAVATYDPKIGDIVDRDGKRLEVGFVNPGGSMRLQDPETHERIPGWHSPSTVKLIERPSAAEEPSEPIVPTEEKPAVIDAKQEGETPAPAVNDLVDTLYRKIAAGQSLGNVTELNKIAESVLGAGRTSGTWTPKDVFDAMEAAVNRYLIDQGARLLSMDAKEGLAELRELMGRLTSQGVRTEEQIKLQQFSTPPTEAYVAALAAALKPSDVALEPSAGNGGLALWPKSIGATVHVNEISPRRREMLRAAGFESTPGSIGARILTSGGILPNVTAITAHDGEIINALLDQNIQPSVILMNPPFSASDQKSHEAKNRSLYGFNHVDSALQRLQKGGRLVAILGGGQANEPNGGASLFGGQSGKWFEKLAKSYNVRANIRISGREYQKYGTSFATRIIVIDKDGPTKSLADVVQGNFDTLEEAYDALRPIAESRQQITAAGPRSQGSTGQGQSGAGVAASGNTGVSVRGEPRGTGVQNGPGTGSAGHGLRGDGRTAPANRPGGGSQPTALHPAGTGSAGPQSPTGGEGAGGSHPDVHGERQDEPPITGLEAGATTGIDLERVENEATPEEEDSAAFVGYNPKVKGPAHPGAIVESKTMATVPSPEITYKPALAMPLESGRLSAVQLEAVALAGAQNDIILPSGARASMLIGDGTGVGKGREGAAIIHDNWAKGRRRLMWVTKSWDLLPAAIVDFKNIGSELAHKVVGLQDFDAKDVLDHEGVMVTTYGLMRSADKKGNTRFAQIDRWLRGKDEGDGAYMLFDESHNLKNAVVGQGGQASQVGVGTKDLIDKMPKLRLTSMSATAASDVMNLGYLADRLGLCGAGTAFPTGFNQFAAAISGGGMSALEMIARELKAQGKYVSRTLSFKGVTYDTVHATLTPDQRAVYRSATRAWRAVVQRAEASITNSTNGGSWQKSRFMSLFYGAQLRFFNVLLTSLKIPAMIERAQQDLKDGKSVIITLINTNEAAQNREKTKAATAKAEDPDDIPEYDFGPSEMLIDLVREHYPVQQFQDDIDSNGRPIKTPVYTTDSEGHQTPVLNPQAVAERNALMAELKRDLQMPGNPLDILIQALGGPKKVAELTGRKEYFDEVKQQFVPRGGKDVPRKKVNQVEMQRFQDGEKRVAILSSAADTGISLHSDNNAKNKQKRSQYTLQPGWSADKAMQMLGRGHRTNQAHAPELHMVESDMAGEKRFIATITRRLGSLNAIARGQKTAGAGASAEAMDKVNFESEQGRQATDMFYRRLLANMEIPGAKAADGTALRGMRILDDLSVLKDDALNGKTVPVADRTNVTKLLNRLMALDPDLQQPVYDYFYDLFNAIVTQAEADGTLDTGVKTLPGETFSIKESRTVAHDPHTKAATDYYKIEAKSPTNRVSPEEYDKRIQGKAGEPDPVVMRNKKTGQLLIARAARPIVHADGTSTLAAHICTPAFGYWSKTPQDDIAARFESVTEHAKGEVTKAEDAVARAERELESAKRYATNITELDERIKTAEDAYRLAVGYNRDYRERELQSLRRRREQADASVIREKEEQTRLQERIDKAKLDLEAAKDRENSVDELTRDEWEKQYNGAPSHRTQEFHLIGGAVMRWWNPIRESIRGSMRIFTTVDSETGKRVVGIEIEPGQITGLLARLSGGGTTVTLDQLRSDVLQNGTEYVLETGIRVTRGRIGGDTVIRFHPPSDATATNLKKLGIVYERGIQPVYYLPEAKYAGDRDQYSRDWDRSMAILKAVLKEYPPTSDAPAAATPQQANRVPRGGGTFSMLGTAALDEPAKAVAAYAVKAGKATYQEAIEKAKATGKSAKVIGRELVGWLYPTALASRDALDIMGKATGEPAMRTFEASQLMHGINKMFNSIAPEEWTDFIDAIENGRGQSNPDLQHAQELMEAIIEAQRERENEAVNLGRNPDVDMKRFTEDLEDGLSNKELGERYGISWQQARAWRKKIVAGDDVVQDRIELTNKPGYFPHRWEVGPQGEKAPSEEQQILRIGGMGRRPFEGSKAFMKQQKWGYRDAIEAGAKPIGSPVKMLMRRLQEGAKFVAARYAWHNLKESGMALFLKRGRIKPVGFSYVEDKSANVWRMIESTELTDEGQNRKYPVEAGRWIVQDDAARLLNNYLSDDIIRGSEIGQAVAKLKNFTTEVRLSWSAFHWGYITAETFRAALQVGIDKLYNQGLRDLDSKAAMEGLTDIGRTMIAPYTAIKMGGQLIQYARTPQEFLASPEGKKFNERYPDAYHLMQLLHQGGLRWSLPDTFRSSFGDHAIEAWREGALGSALGKTLPWLAHMVAKPLFEHYIPRAKWAFAVQNLAAKLAQYSEALANGSVTEVQLARQIAEMSDNFFGEVNWDSLFLKNSMRTGLQLLFRSATWKMGSWRGLLQAGKESFTSQAFDDDMIARMEDQSRRWDWARKYTTRLPQLGPNTAALLSMMIFVGITGSILGKVASGKWPWEWAKEAKNNRNYWANAAMEAMHFRTGRTDLHGEPIRFSFPTGLKDYEHGYEHPWRYIKGSESDILSNAIDSLANEDAFGNYVYDPNDPLYSKIGAGLLYNIKGDFLPMSVSNWNRTYGSQDFAGKAARATGTIGGAPKWLDRSAALEEAVSLQRHQAHTPEQMQEWEYARSAPPTRQALLKAHREKDMDYLEKLVEKMSYTDAMKVYELATPAERADLKRLIMIKRYNAVKAGRQR